MKKFKFTLQTIHSVREMRQEKEEFVLSQMQAEAIKTAGRIRQIEEARQAAIENYNTSLKRGEAMNIGEMELETAHIASLDRQRRQTQELLEQQNQSCLRQKTTLAAAAREVKVTEKLRETQQTRHRTELDRHEQNALDEMVSANYARKMSQTY
ncbi:MAG: flagellar export protein FliJ [Pyrinomonadaceae bacterium]|nr:flagellar export protein FliJ [Pyrinomonadaceae bacterium]